ncbi:MAG: ATP-binding cassette domain-containing protein [Clostridium sp.]|nr:MAG: ATP-binding cassette domain-containing protein [Clostridium sp.]
MKNITVHNNLKIALELIGITNHEEQEKRIKYVLEAVGMYKYRKKQANKLSGGQMQRVSIARALLKESKLIIADEPTGNLDSENSIEVMNILKKISKKTLVLLVTHNKELANFYSDRIIEIADGTIINDEQINTLNQTLNITRDNQIHLLDLNKEDIEKGKYQNNPFIRIMMKK